MKKLYTISLAFALTLCATSAYAKIWRVNNNPGGFAADFTTLQAAHDGAAANDTIYLEGSPTNYGGLSCSKKLIMMGPGYFLVQNNITQTNTSTAVVSHIYMYDGSQGSEIIGLDFNGSGLDIRTSDIIVKRNKFSQSSGNATTLGEIIYSAGGITFNSSTANNIVISQNFGLAISGPNHILSGLLITNNLISTHSWWGEEYDTPSMHLHEFTMALIQNNIFLRGRINVNRSSLTNNILINGFFDVKENMIANNIGKGTQFGTENGNQSNIDMSTVFLGTGSPDERFKLKVGSPAIGAGYGSTNENPVDAGMFFGNTPYRLSGLPGIPVIYFINVQAVGSNTDPIDVTVKVKSTN